MLGHLLPILMKICKLQCFFKQRSAIALQAYLDKINQRSLQIAASPGDPDFDAKIRAAIRQKLENNISSDRL